MENDLRNNNILITFLWTWFCDLFHKLGRNIRW